MKGAASVLGAGSAFAVAALAGLFIGELLRRATGTTLWVPAGFLAGALAGAAAAFRLLAQGMK